MLYLFVQRLAQGLVSPMASWCHFVCGLPAAGRFAALYAGNLNFFVFTFYDFKIVVETPLNSALKHWNRHQPLFRFSMATNVGNEAET